MRLRHAAIAPLALLLLGLVATPVAAGGVAVVIPVDTGGVSVTAGKVTTVGFQLLQHGVTPVDFGVTSVVFVDTATGERFAETAKPIDKEGRFEATFTYPRGGFWTWHVEHDGLGIESAPVTVGVFESDGTMPAFWPGAPQDAATFGMQTKIDDLTRERDGLRRQLDDLRAAGATSATALAAAQDRPTMPAFVLSVLGAVIVGILAGVGLTLVTGRSRVPQVRELSVGAPAEAD
jgi:hypothetical protein